MSRELRERIFRMVAENSTLGRSARSWRVEDARLGHLGKNGLALDAGGPEESCVCEALVRLSCTTTVK